MKLTKANERRINSHFVDVKEQICYEVAAWKQLGLAVP